MINMHRMIKYAPTVLAACCGFDLCLKYIWYLVLNCAHCRAAGNGRVDVSTFLIPRKRITVSVRDVGRLGCAQEPCLECPHCRGVRVLAARGVSSMALQISILKMGAGIDDLVDMSHLMMHPLL